MWLHRLFPSLTLADNSPRLETCFKQAFSWISVVQHRKIITGIPHVKGYPLNRTHQILKDYHGSVKKEMKRSWSMGNQMFCMHMQKALLLRTANSEDPLRYHPWNALSLLPTVAVAAPAGLKPASFASICSSSNQQLDRDAPCNDLSALVVTSHVFRFVARKCSYACTNAISVPFSYLKKTTPKMSLSAPK